MKKTNQNGNQPRKNASLGHRAYRLLRAALLHAATTFALVLPSLGSLCRGEVVLVDAQQPSGLVAVTAGDAERTAADSTPLTRVEEDWEMVVGEPDLPLSAPQVCTVMTPFEDETNSYVAFYVNHRLNPSAAPGGVEVQFWYGGRQQSWAGQGSNNLLHHADETVSWTQRLEVRDGSLRFEIRNGHSETWGDFGEDHSLRVSVPSTLESLPHYQSATSVNCSGVTFASDRVRSLVLRDVRGYAADGTLLFEESNPVVVFESQSD